MKCTRGTTVAEVAKLDVTFRARPQRLADRVVPPRVVRLHLRDPLPRLADAAGAEHLRNGEGAVPHESLAVLVTRAQDVDGDEVGLRLVGAAIPEHLPDLFGCGVDLDLVVMLLHRRLLNSRCSAVRDPRRARRASPRSRRS